MLNNNDNDSSYSDVLAVSYVGLEVCSLPITKVYERFKSQRQPSKYLPHFGSYSSALTSALAATRFLLPLQRLPAGAVRTNDIICAKPLYVSSANQI